MVTRTDSSVVTHTEGLSVKEFAEVLKMSKEVTAVEGAKPSKDPPVASPGPAAPEASKAAPGKGDPLALGWRAHEAVIGIAGCVPVIDAPCLASGRLLAAIPGIQRRGHRDFVVHLYATALPTSAFSILHSVSACRGT